MKFNICLKKKKKRLNFWISENMLQNVKATREVQDFLKQDLITAEEEVFNILHYIIIDKIKFLQLFSLLVQQGELLKIFKKYLKEEETPQNEKKVEETAGSNAGEEILQGFNDYLYKKYNCEAFNKSSFIIYKNKNNDQNPPNFSTLLSIEDNNNNNVVERLNTAGSNELVIDSIMVNTGTKALSPFPQSKMMASRNSMNLQVDSNIKMNLQVDSNIKSSYLNNDPKYSMNPSRMMTKINIANTKNLSRKEESKSGINDTKCFTTNKCSLFFIKKRILLFNFLRFDLDYQPPVYRVSTLKKGKYEKKCIVSENIFDGRVYLRLNQDSQSLNPLITLNSHKTESTSKIPQKKKQGNKAISDLNSYFSCLIEDDLNKKNITKEIDQLLIYFI